MGRPYCVGEPVIGVPSQILVMLRRLDTKFDGLRDEFREIKGRLTNVETVLAAVATELGSLVGADARMQHSIDRLADRLECVERRLGLIDAPPL